MRLAQSKSVPKDAAVTLFSSAKCLRVRLQQSEAAGKDSHVLCILNTHLFRVYVWGCKRIAGSQAYTASSN